MYLIRFPLFFGQTRDVLDPRLVIGKTGTLQTICDEGLKLVEVVFRLRVARKYRLDVLAPDDVTNRIRALRSWSENVGDSLQAVSIPTTRSSSTLA